MQEYYLSHRGNKVRKIRADTHHAYKTIRLCLDAWMTRYNRRVAHREKLTYMHDQINERLKLIVLAEWKQYLLSRQLRKAQQATAVEAFRQSMKSKVFLSLKFFTVYTKRQAKKNEKGWNTIASATSLPAGHRYDCGSSSRSITEPRCR